MVHSIAVAVELYVQALHPVPQLAHCPAVAPKLNPVLHEVQVIAPVLLERVQVAQLETPQESHVVEVSSFAPYLSSHMEHVLAPEEASVEQVLQKGGQAMHDPLSSL